MILNWLLYGKLVKGLVMELNKGQLLALMMRKKSLFCSLASSVVSQSSSEDNDLVLQFVTAVIFGSALY